MVASSELELADGDIVVAAVKQGTEASIRDFLAADETAEMPRIDLP
jgi:hypothetical protein